MPEPHHTVDKILQRNVYHRMPPTGPKILGNLTPEEADRRLGTIEMFFNEPGQALICVLCRYALKRTGETAPKHLWEKHQTLPKTSNLSACIKTLCLTDPTELPLRQDGSEPHPHLSANLDTECRRFGYQLANEKLIARHMSKTNDLRRGSNN